ncbi:MAG: hypothetical protein KDJ52_24000 [Anaerolineae bacterium]|nr:hypothetical protein [Anaerolineae bacterium]
MSSFTSEEILQQLDKCAADFTFPMLDNGYVYPADTRLSLYRDEKRWAMIIEVLGFTPRASGINGLQNCLHCFGNCLERKPGTNNEDFLYPIIDGPSGPLFDEAFGEVVNEQVSDFHIRDSVVKIPKDRKLFQQKGIILEKPPSILAFEFLRVLIPEYRDSLLANEAELRDRIPPKLPLILRLDEWYHPDLAENEQPSQNSTFKTLAEVLVTGKPALYRPFESPNTHWKHWPAGGTL